MGLSLLQKGQYPEATYSSLRQVQFDSIIKVINEHLQFEKFIFI